MSNIQQDEAGDHAGCHSIDSENSIEKGKC